MQTDLPTMSCAKVVFALRRRNEIFGQWLPDDGLGIASADKGHCIRKALIFTFVFTYGKDDRTAA